LAPEDRNARCITLKASPWLLTCAASSSNKSLAGFAIQQGQKNAHKGRLWGIYVRPSSTKLGVGRLLVSAVLDVAREHVELIQLSVVKENGPARRLYESVGFLQFGMEPKASKLGDKYYDEAHMALDFSFSRPVEVLVDRWTSPRGQPRRSLQ
jgi:ribosomal protein S18 acetylase RimI-like enzyme